jgi:hypothetical protein
VITISYPTLPIAVRNPRLCYYQIVCVDLPIDSLLGHISVAGNQRKDPTPVNALYRMIQGVMSAIPGRGKSEMNQPSFITGYI